MRNHTLLHRLEPTPHTAVQSVVLHRLIMRAMFGLRHCAITHDKARMPPQAIASAVFEVFIATQTIPRRRERGERLHRHIHRRAHIGRPHHHHPLRTHGYNTLVNRDNRWGNQ